ncbi:unnamed protein product [Heterobilharzia americana]|nr:unnamed protein product [Heterobilharzia americana]
MWESNRTRWDPTRNTENRRRDNSGHAHTTIAEGVEGREGTWRLEEGLPCQTAEEMRPQCLQELARNHLLSTRSKQNIKPHHPGEAKGCTGFKTTTGIGWLAGFWKYKSCADQIATLHHASSLNTV